MIKDAAQALNTLLHAWSTKLSHPNMQTAFGPVESSAIISTTVEDPQDAFGMTRLRFGSHIIKVDHLHAAKGETVRLRIPARHVAIALEPPDGTSFQNIIAGEVRKIAMHCAPFVDVRMDIGSPLWARITRQSCQDMNLQPGRTVYALIKSISVSLGAADACR
jgi:molybdate transport system ATP-binding protein